MTAGTLCSCVQVTNISDFALCQLILFLTARYQLTSPGFIGFCEIGWTPYFLIQNFLSSLSGAGVRLPSASTCSSPEPVFPLPRQRPARHLLLWLLEGLPF